MKHYIDENGNLFAYEADGSQDDLIPDNQTPATPEQVQAAQNPMPSDNDAIYAQITAIEFASLTNRGARELHMRLIEKEAAAVATTTNTVEKILAKQSYYIKLKAENDQITLLRKGLK